MRRKRFHIKKLYIRCFYCLEGSYGDIVATDRHVYTALRALFLHKTNISVNNLFLQKLSHRQASHFSNFVCASLFLSISYCEKHNQNQLKEISSGNEQKRPITPPHRT